MSREVELIIRAKDEASKFVDSITDSLKGLTAAQGDVSQSAVRTGSLLDKLGKEFKDLNEEAKRLGSLGKIAENLDKSAASVKNLGNSLGQSATEFSALARESSKAANELTRLRSSLEAEENTLRTSTAARKQASKELTEASRALAQAERNQARYNKAVGDTPQQFIRPGARSAAAFITGDVEASRAAQARLTEDVARYAADIDRSKKAVETLKPQVQALSRQQSTLADQTQKASGALSTNLDTLERARGAFAGIRSAADQASVAMGGIAVTQDNVAQASARVAAELARTKAQIDAISKAPRVTAPTSDISGATKETEARRAAIERLRDLRKEMASAQADAQRLNREFAATAAPTREMGTAAGQAQARVRELKAELDTLTTRLRASQGGFLQWSQSAGQLRGATTGAAAAASNLASASSQAGNSIRPMGSAAQAAGQGLNNAANGANSLRNAFSGVYGESRKSLSLFQRIRGELLALTAGYLGLQAAINNIGGVITAFQTLEAAQNRLGAVFNQDTGRVAQELQFLERQADRLGIEFGVLANQYAKFSVAANAANFESNATRKIFLSVAEAGRVNKLSIDQLNGIFLALEQMISKGKVSAEELRRQLGDRLPGAFNIFAQALGLTTAQLDEMMKKGEVLSTQSNLLKFATELDKRFGSQLATSLQSTTTEIGRFSNNIYQAQLLVAQGGFIDSFTRSLRQLNQYFSSREGRDFFLSLSAALGRFTDALAQVPKYFSEITLGLQVFASVKIAGVLTNLIGSFRNVTTAATSFSRSLTLIGPPTQAAAQAQTAFSRVLGTSLNRLDAWRASTAAAGGGLRALSLGLSGLRGIVITMTGLFRGLWAAVGGIPGIILSGITLAIGSWTTQIDGATAALDEHQRQMQAIKGAYDEAKGKVIDWAKEVKGLTISQAEDNLTKLLESYNNRFDQLRDKTLAVRTVLQQLSADQNMRAMVDPADIDNMEGLVRLLDQLQNKQISIDQFRQGLDLIARSTKNSGLKSLAVDMQNFINESEEGGTSIAVLTDAIDKAQARIRLLKGEATEADKSLLGLSDSSDKAGSSTTKLTENSAKLNEAFDEMSKLIVKTGDELKRLETINGLDKQYNDAIKLARTMGDVYRLTDQYNKALNSTIEGSISGNSGIVDRIIGIESGGNANAKNPNSSATGLGQFIESTWLRMFKQYFPDRAAGLTDAMILELRKNATISKEMVALYVQENAKILKQAGVAVTDANLYLAHFLGPGGASKVLQASGNQRVADILAPSQVAANQSILGGGQTVQGLIKWAERKVGISQSEAAVQKELSDLDVKREEKAREYNSDLERRLALQADENGNAGRLTKEGFIQKALAEEQKRAKAAGVVLDQQQIAQIEQLAAKEYEINQAKRDGKASTQEANIALQQAVALNQQRNELQRQFNEAQKMGDMTNATSLQSQLLEVNGKLDEAILKAREMWEQIGGSAADVALTKLDTLKLKTDAAANSMTIFGLSTQQIGQLAGSFADGLVGVFDSFAQAVANGENAVEALGKAFLQFAANFLREIATMILKQLILNALQGLGIPGLGSAHTGGLVGGAGVGSGNMRKGAAIGASFIKYHTGGLAGLRPDEVPTVLKEGEEVLTEADPRHRFNQTKDDAAKGGSGGQPIKQVLVFNERELADALATSHGEKVMITTIKRNAATIRQVLS